MAAQIVDGYEYIDFLLLLVTKPWYINNGAIIATVEKYQLPSS